MKLLPAAPLKDKYWISIERLIQKVFFEAYRDLFILTRPEQKLYNSKDPLSIAIMASRVGFSNGTFFGKFSSSTTKQLREMGAKYDPSSKTWKLPTKGLPATIQATLSAKDSEDALVNDQALSIIDNLDIPKIIEDSGIEIAYNKSIRSMSTDIDKSIGIKVVLTEEQQEIIAKEWTDNLDLYIQNFMAENITELRQEVLDNTIRGSRAENLVDIIGGRFNVTKSKAKFLARQETSLLMSKMRETRYKDAGLNKYKWLTSGNEKVRDSHKRLNNNEYFWSDPPIVDDKGKRAHPGEDFNCVCIAVPILE